jgi:hypothetical protein
MKRERSAINHSLSVDLRLAFLELYTDGGRIVRMWGL